MRTTRGGVILLFSDQQHEAQREKVAGVYTASIKRGWQIVPISDYPSEDVIRREVESWRPIGAIVDPIFLSRPLDRKPFGRIPVVLMGIDDKRTRQIFDCTSNDDMSPARAAFDVLQRRAFASYAYLPHPTGQYWSRKRGRAFRSCVSRFADGHPTFHVYAGSGIDSSSGRQELERWIAALPKPCGVLLATDQLATTFFVAAARAKVLIPDEVAVVGVDDLEFICRSTIPHLTSVDIDFTKAGQFAVELIERRIADPRAPRETLYYPATGVTRRGSTGDVIADTRVRRALDFIEQHHTEAISVMNVVRTMGCCRRLAERTFAGATGKTILEKIREERLERAFTLLRDQRIPLNEIPALCGYESITFFQSFFKRATGRTMRDWRMTAAKNI